MYFIIRNRFWTALRQNMVHFWHRSGKKEAEIQELENKLVSAQNKMDDLKKQDVQIKDICLYGMYISEMEDQIWKKQEQLKLLQQQEEKKKEQVIAAKIDTSVMKS